MRYYLYSFGVGSFSSFNFTQKKENANLCCFILEIQNSFVLFNRGDFIKKIFNSLQFNVFCGT